MRILACLQDTPGALIKASEVAQLDPAAFSQRPILSVLAAAGLLYDDREPAIIGWFTQRIDSLPQTMAEEVRLWFDTLLNGSAARPRSRPRAQVTVRLRVSYALPALAAWADAGHASLRTIGREEIGDAVPPHGNDRALTGQALRSLFRTLKARKMIFADPTARARNGRPETRIPLPIDAALFSAALESESPARAVIAALIGFHALRSHQLRSLKLTEIRDGRIRLDGREILLAPPARRRLAKWHRNSLWPNTSNPHLLINKQAAVRTAPVSNVWINGILGLPAQAIREDRILDEAIATRDLRRLCDLFGLSVEAAQRYIHTVRS